MNADFGEKNAAPLVEETPSEWRAALKTLSSKNGRWRHGRRQTVSSTEYIEPRAFCDTLLAEALAHRRFLDVRERARFFDWACDIRGVEALVPIAAAHDVLARGDVHLAQRYLELAIVIDQEDLYAQELWFAARGDPIQPVDAAKRFCPNPFERLESASRNRLMFCCPAWLPVAAGSLDDDSAEDVWNSPAAKDIRASIHDGSYRYCSRMHCPMFSDDRLPRVVNIRDHDMREVIRTKATVLPPKIKRMALAHDRSCNLSCPSCRTKLLIADREANKRLDDLTHKALLPLILTSRRISITGSGDPFSSKHYRKIIRQLTSLPEGPIIDLQTNGLMLARSWDELKLEGRAGKVLVSIDAATKQTYEVVRRGGLFEELLDNLAFLRDLRRRNGVESVRLDFVVQALNFREMPAAAALMREFQFDQIKFQMLRSWNTWTPREFSRHHVGSPEHPEFHELQAVLLDERLAGDDVRFSGFYSLRPERLRSAARSDPTEARSNGDARQADSRA